MEFIIPVTGKVTYVISLDPGVWIFDERKIDISSLFSIENQRLDEQEKYVKEVSAHWDREITEGSLAPSVQEKSKKTKKEELLNGSFAIPLFPFLKNAAPHEDAALLTIHAKAGATTIPLKKAEEAFLAFSKDGKPLLEDGPVHFYYGDGSNQYDPITHIIKFEIH